MSDFISRISIVCFAASYAVALGCEASRPVFRSAFRGLTLIGFTAAGLAAHTLFLGWRALNASAVPLSSPFDWYLLAAWLLAAGSLYFTIANPRTPVGLFMLPVVLALVGAAQLSSREPFPQTPATQVWGAIHGSFNLAASVSVAIGATAGLMWLIQASRLARKQPPLRGFRMPSLERLAQTTDRSLAFAAWTAAAGFISGIVLNAVNRSRGLLEIVPWTDPVVLRMGALVAWLIAADWLSTSARRRPDGGRVTAWLSVASLAILSNSILWGVFGATRHGVPPAPHPAIVGPPAPVAGDAPVGGPQP
jgi:ABC-type transport system involved in cytochrome c biogenesis permease subunit